MNYSQHTRECLSGCTHDSQHDHEPEPRCPDGERLALEQEQRRDAIDRRITLAEAQADYDRACKDCDAAEALHETLCRAIDEVDVVRKRAAARLSDAQIALDAAREVERAKVPEETK